MIGWVCVKPQPSSCVLYSNSRRIMAHHIGMGDPSTYLPTPLHTHTHTSLHIIPLSFTHTPLQRPTAPGADPSSGEGATGRRSAGLPVSTSRASSFHLIEWLCLVVAGEIRMGEGDDIRVCLVWRMIPQSTQHTSQRTHLAPAKAHKGKVRGQPRVQRRERSIHRLRPPHHVHCRFH